MPLPLLDFSFSWYLGRFTSLLLLHSYTLFFLIVFLAQRNYFARSILRVSFLSLVSRNLAMNELSLRCFLLPQECNIRRRTLFWKFENIGWCQINDEATRWGSIFHRIWIPLGWCQNQKQRNYFSWNLLESVQLILHRYIICIYYQCCQLLS